MKTNYETPTIEIMELVGTDVICTSNELNLPDINIEEIL